MHVADAAALSRRAALGAAALALAALAPAVRAASPPLLQLAAVSPTVPTAYVECVRKVVSSLGDSIAFEAEGASERAVRRKADGAKGDIERFLRDWKGDPRVTGDASYVAVVEALRQLGTFYAAKGPRSALTREVREGVLQALRNADAALN